MRFSICSLLLLCISLGTVASQNTMASPNMPQAYSAVAEIELPRLLNGGTVSLADYQDKVVFITFFEPDCPWCYRQMKVLNRVASECGHHLQPVAVGINGDAHSLRHELRRAKVSFPTAKATPELLQLVGAVPATPWTLIFRPPDQFLGKLQGYMEFEKIQALFPASSFLKVSLEKST